MMKTTQTQTAGSAAQKIQENSATTSPSPSDASSTAQQSASSSNDVETIPTTVEGSESQNTAKVDDGEKKSVDAGP